MVWIWFAYVLPRGHRLQFNPHDKVLGGCKLNLTMVFRSGASLIESSWFLKIDRDQETNSCSLSLALYSQGTLLAGKLSSDVAP